MPAYRRGGAQPGRGRGRGGGRGGQARGGGPRLPSAITDELGLPSQKKSEHVNVLRSYLSHIHQLIPI